MAENISTINKTGQDYDTLALWEDAKDGDITAGNAETAEVYDDDGEMSSATVGCYLWGWTTDANSYIRIYAPDAERRLVPDSLRYGFGARLKVTGANTNVIYAREGAEFLRIEGLEFAVDHDTDAGYVLVFNYQFSTDASDIRISDCVVAFLGNNADVGIGIWGKTGVSHVFKFWNCCIYGGTIGIFCTDAEVYIYNCTIYGCSNYGIYESSATAYVWNVLSYDNNIDFDGTFSGDYNFSKDDTAPGGNSIHGDTDGKNPQFKSVVGGSEDLHIRSVSDARQAARNDPSSGLYSDDIDRQARP